MISCDCSVENYDSAACYKMKMITARKPHTCCECHGTIEAGQRYERVDAAYDGHWSHYDTCQACKAIREHYCPGGWVHEELAETIEDCLGFDYREVPGC